ncbi:MULTISPECIES: DUF6387 family protein [Enterobacter cloacae complex]|uniref:DUF6387 family protein n=1 Tax=Enterobacter cloacae complex TaxID=354276 RepID=UPI000666F00F|nr:MULTISPECIES: DUF6387 family protein [Enterobacter cloacae complex]ELJ5835064.1 hypothetical protein [Enterobacter kobei]MDU7382296.1 DUF6387 family protein [Enterobacteriaceae bacterium]DAW17341.1 MAG TPA: hypothetical protein [Caudoviricetes sp.]HAW3027049.1 hypothetical protein [Escherichia coli]HCT2132579.1 hypothetical protein [Enterobacter hormaechei]
MRINKKSDLPKWFSLSDYECYKNMSDNELINQLEGRCNAYCTEQSKQFGFFGKTLYKGVIKSEYEGVVSFGKNKEYDKTFYLSKSRTISPISIRDLNFMWINLIEKKDIHIDGKVDVDFHDDYQHVSAIDLASLFFDGLFCRINILKHDDIIIDELKILLKKWREELDIKEPEPLIKNGWEVIRNKIIDYNAFPMIDLMLWEMATGHKITTGVLAVALFPEGEYDSIQINQTIKKFVVALLDYRTLEKIEHEISNK